MLVYARSRVGSSSSTCAMWACPCRGCRHSLTQWPSLPQLRLLVVGGAAMGATLGTSSCPTLGASRLAALVAAHRGRRLPLLPITLAGLPLFLSEM
jgi:hypothetical protein